MSDDLSQRGEPDRSRVSLSEDHEVRYWSQRFNTTEDQLRAAVQAVGSSAEAVASWLAGKR